MQKCMHTFGSLEFPSDKLKVIFINVFAVLCLTEVH